MPDRSTREDAHLLKRVRDSLLQKEMQLASAPYASLSNDSKGRRRTSEPSETDNRTAFARDRDRIIYSHAFIRLSGKTQVFLSPHNPLISNRLTHSLHVAQISKAIARALHLNEDLVEAIALGHDLGHSPFGHQGEKTLDELCRREGIGRFRHNVQSLRVVDIIEKEGKGLNLTWEVREGILSHDGEVPGGEISPTERIHAEVEDWTEDEYRKPPSTLEGCIVRLCDRIAYAGKDIEDALEAKILKPSDLARDAKDLAETLGSTNSEIIDTCVKDIIANFLKFVSDFRAKNGREPTKLECVIRMSPRVREALNKLIHEFNYPRIYLSSQNLRYSKQSERIIRGLFDSFLDELRSLRTTGVKLFEFGGGPGECSGNVDDSVKDILYRSFLRMSLGELESITLDMAKDFSEGFVLRVVPGDCKDEVRNGLQRSVLGEFKKAFSSAIDRARIRILQDLSETRKEESSYSSIGAFLSGKSKDYLAGTNCAEKVRDFISTLTDDVAVSIFQRLYVPQAIV